MMLKAIVFDMDGVLFDTERLGQIILKKVAMEQNAVVSDEAFFAMLGTNLDTSRRIMGAAHPNVDYDLMIKRWNEMIFKTIEENGIPLKKGMPNILDKLKKRGLKVGLATSSERESMMFYLERCGLENTFDATVCGGEVKNGKPAPDIYLQCAKLLDVEPEDCAGVEDSLNGIKAVRAAGMLSVMIPDMLPFSSLYQSFVDKVLQDLTQLESLL